MLLTGVVLFCTFLCILAFVVTFRLGATQTQQSNEDYMNKRKRTVLILTCIYVIATLIGVIYAFIK